MIVNIRNPLNKRFLPAIPEGDISCREQSFFELQDREVQEIFSRRVVQYFRRSSKLVLDGQVKFDV